LLLFPGLGGLKNLSFPVLKSNLLAWKKVKMTFYKAKSKAKNNKIRVLK
jgi:hypothetical protein